MQGVRKPVHNLFEVFKHLLDIALAQLAAIPSDERLNLAEAARSKIPVKTSVGIHLILHLAQLGKLQMTAAWHPIEKLAQPAIQERCTIGF